MIFETYKGHPMTPQRSPVDAETGDKVLYRKTALVEAHQWRQNGDHPRDGDGSTEGDLVRYFRRPEPDYRGDKAHETCGYTWHRHGWIDDLEGGHVVCPHDWILTGPAGESWAVKPEIFAATYERVTDV